ncbi:unnamed protein product [Soboliphyme baturini]|uniref:Ubiq_cyt_C_chap domain-containing protein n=1 Tax=Soboliphyme baturini TaxID=241478 RepID=A0A183IUW2_9BILA|nr:unnamed protein product [Soboliphyme baturini]
MASYCRLWLVKIQFQRNRCCLKVLKQICSVNFQSCRSVFGGPLMLQSRNIGSSSQRPYNFINAAVVGNLLNFVRSKESKADAVAYKLEDTLTSWFKVTLLHVWLILFRFSEEKFLPTVRNEVVQCLWDDVNVRFDALLKKRLVQPSQRKEVLELYYSLLITSFCEYDEVIITLLYGNLTPSQFYLSLPFNLVFHCPCRQVKFIAMAYSRIILLFSDLRQANSSNAYVKSVQHL